MKHGNISNESAPVLCFNLENIILTKIKQSLGRYKYEPNMININFINEYFWRSYTYSVQYVSLESPSKLKDIEEILELHGALFSNIIIFDTVQDLKKYLDNVDAQYFDTDNDLINRVGKRATKFMELKR